MGKVLATHSPYYTDEVLEEVREIAKRYRSELKDGEYFRDEALIMLQTFCRSILRKYNFLYVLPSGHPEEKRRISKPEMDTMFQWDNPLRLACHLGSRAGLLVLIDKVKEGALRVSFITAKMDVFDKVTEVEANDPWVFSLC